MDFHPIVVVLVDVCSNHTVQVNYDRRACRMSLTKSAQAKYRICELSQRLIVTHQSSVIEFVLGNSIDTIPLRSNV
jgi:hypothetical protein